MLPGHAVGKPISALHLEKAGVTVSAVRRGGICGPEPAPEKMLATGEVMLLCVTPEALNAAEKILLEV